ncbi:tripartite motif-containing protein 71 [Mytilus galloprovincialis]|uniref:Tripartite motif-containing protein 71 n=1 Tax=Mytilus galloprovincialis TaxID=29158 RepID=A0A8B6GGY3_MYTGA|nr:tripartite motif-containing protein 71 [Mytilus galloprovincialis]
MAQNLILCQLCEKPKEIKWKCFNCDLVLCQKCVNKHSKFSGSEDHCIIDFKQVGTPKNLDIIRKFNLKNIKCGIHTEENCTLFCIDCKTPLCSFCVIESTHKNHNIDKLSVVYSNQLSELKDIQERIQQNLPDIRKSVRESDATSDNYHEVIERIIQREKELKERVTEEAAKLIEELDKLIIPSKGDFIEEKQKIQKVERKLTEANKEIDSALKSHQATSVLTTYGRVRKDFQLNMNSDNIPLEQKFTLIVPDSLSINFGSIKKCPILKVINTYETNLPVIRNLKSLQDGTLVCYFNKNDDDFYLSYSDEQGDKYIFKNELCVTSSTWPPTDMTVTDDDMILLTNGTDEIQCLNAYDENLKAFEWDDMDNEPGIHTFKLDGIHSFKDKILVGFEEYFHHIDDDHLEGTETKGVLIIYNEDHNELVSAFEENRYRLIKLGDSRGESVICIIFKLTRNINGDINIIFDNDIAVLDCNFKLKWRWTNFNHHHFLDIVTTSTGLVVVADGSSIKVLSIDGDFLTSIGKQDNILHVYCLHIDKSGQLLVGCKSETDESAKIHRVKILD